MLKTKNSSNSNNTILLYLLVYLLTINLKILSTKMAEAQIPVKVGVVLDMDAYGNMAFNCISTALTDFYATHDHYKTRLDLISRDSKGDVIGAAAAALDLLKNVQVQAIIGPMYSVQANFLISLGQRAEVPIITFSATSPSLSLLRSPYFIRAALKDSSQVGPIVAIVQAFGWREVVLIDEDNEFGEGIVPFMIDALGKAKVLVPYRSVIPPLATDDQIAAELYKLMTMQTRIFIVHMLNPLAARLFTKAKEIGMMSQDYAWITTDSVANDFNSMDPPSIMLGVIGVRPYFPKTKQLDDFRIRYKEIVQQTNPKALNSDPDIFVLWAYDSAIALAMAAEEAGYKDLTYQVTKTSSNSTDLESFGVSLSGPNLTRALSNTTFVGLAGNFRLINGELQAPPYEIVNMVGPEARVIGYWTKENGIVNEPNFTSSSANAYYSTSKSNLGSTIWPGNKSSPPKGWVVPTNGKKLRVGVPVKVSFTEFVRVTWNSDNSTKVEGYCIDVFDAVMAALPYGVPYEYIPFATPDHEIAGDYNDLAHQVYLGNYDAVAGDITIVGNRSQYVDFTLPYTESGISMVVPVEDDKSGNKSLFLKPLTRNMWFLTVACFVSIGIMVYVFERPINKEFRGALGYELGMIFWFPVSTVFFAHREKVVSNSARFVLIVWFFAVFVLTQSYSASLTSMLTVQKLQPTVTDINVLIRNKEKVGYSHTSFIFGFLKSKFNESQLISFDTSEKMDELLSKGSSNGGIAAAFLEIPYIKLFLGKYCSKYVMVGPTYKADGFGFVFPKDSPLIPDVSRTVLNVTEGQKMVEIEERWLGDKTKCVEPDTLLRPEGLGVSSFQIIFYLVAAIGLATITKYICEYRCKRPMIIDDERPTILANIHELHKLLTNFNNRN